MYPQYSVTYNRNGIHKYIATDILIMFVYVVMSLDEKFILHLFIKL